MSWRPSVAVALLLSIIGNAGHGQERSASPSVASVVSALVDEPVQRGECVGLAVDIDNGGEQGFYSYGSMIRGSGKPPAPTTEFEIGSITKVFTTTLLALYERRRLVKLDDPLQKYVPPGIAVPAFSGRQITLIDLATHTSGLPRVPPIRADSYSPNEMFAFLNGYRLTRAPGSQFEYSNLGIALLAHALARATGMPWEALVERDITAKLGMVDTRLRLDHGQRSRLAIGYNPAGMRARENMPTWPAFNGAGALFSTASDMRRFLAWNMGKTTSDLNDLLEDLHRPRFALARPGAAVGLAWQLIPFGKPGSSIVWKDGGTPGYSAYIGFSTHPRSGVVLLANTAKCPVQRMGTHILASLSGQAPATIQVPEASE
jgi:D-alanyl-D-alanine-carboxypeptidase/D-alanyl-D-alanine-endopeptidase